MQDKEKIARWNNDRWKDKLTWSRRSMWLPETIDRLADWIGLRPGMTVVDVGCGLGYMGRTYWLHFGEAGEYIGLDIADKLIRGAVQEASQWSRGGRTMFARADAYRLPLPSDIADCSMCQALLMHLKDAESALAEMVRVTRPGGIIVCQEQDEHASLLPGGYESAPEFNLEEELLLIKGSLLYSRGRKALGWGDNRVAPRIPRLMKTLGLVDIDVRGNELPYHLTPPFDDPIQQDQLSKARTFYLEGDGYERWMEVHKQAYLAGGGDPREYERYRELADERTEAVRRQLRTDSYSICKVNQWYVIRGRKTGRPGR